MKLLQSNYLLIKEKLEGTLSTQKDHFQDRLDKFDQLTAYTNEVKQDPVLQPVLYQDISTLIE